MVRFRTWLGATAVAAAAGGVTGAVVIVLTGSPSTLPPAPEPGPDPHPAAVAADSVPAAGSSPAVPRGARAAALTRRIDSVDEETRHALALELLRRGPDALAQARALRPVTPAGVELHDRLVLALDKMRLVRRGTDYPKLAPHLRMRLDLDAFASVVPEWLLLDERLAYWRREVEAVSARLAKGYAAPAEESLALLELARARHESGELDAGDYAAEASTLLPVIDAWIRAQRDERGAVPARIAELEIQVARLRP